MIDDAVDVIGTAILLVAPVLLVLVAIIVVVAYPWLLLVAFGIWFLAKKRVPDDMPSNAKATEK